MIYLVFVAGLANIEALLLIMAPPLFNVDHMEGEGSECLMKQSRDKIWLLKIIVRVVPIIGNNE